MGLVDSLLIKASVSVVSSVGLVPTDLTKFNFNLKSQIRLCLTAPCSQIPA